MEIIIYKEGDKIFTASNNETNWTFVKESEPRIYKNEKAKIFTVKCKCGRIKDVKYNNIRTGKSICCGFDPCRIPINKGSKSIETSYKSLFYSYKKGASNRNFNFDLTYEQFKEYLHKNCFYCNSIPTQEYRILKPGTNEIRAGVPITYNGIDRKDSKIGYTTENCVTCCKGCNRMKMGLNDTDFLNNIKRIYEYLKLNKNE